MRITFVNIYVPYIGTAKYVKQILTDLKGKINTNTITVEDFNIPFSIMHRLSRQKIYKETLDLNYTLD